MRDTKFSWFLFSALDAAAVEQRLNAYADRGWQLNESEDCHCAFVKLKRTERKDLRYCVLPARPGRSTEELHATIQHQRDCGWEALATINGLDIYQSIPCYEVTYEEQRHQPSRQALLKPLFPVILGACALALALWLLYEPMWYLSYLSTLLHNTYLPAAVGAVLWLICLVGKAVSSEKGCVPLMWVRSGLALLAYLWVWVLIGMLLLDALPAIYAWMVFVLATAAVIACQVRLSRGNRLLCVNVISWIVLGSIFIGVAAPRFVSKQGRDISVLSLAQFDMETGTREYTEYESYGSFLVSVAEYGEVWSEDAYLSSEIYLCRTSGLAEQVAADLLARQGVATGDSLWYSEDGTRMILKEGNVVLKLWINGLDLEREENMAVIQSYLSTLNS